MKTLLHNGMIHDGDGNSFLGDILIEGDRILKIGHSIDISDANVIDVSGLDIVPGFIDAHRHADFALLRGDVGRAELSQGITTCITGPCGMSIFPVTEDSYDEWYSFIKPCLGEKNGKIYPDAKSYLSALENQNIPLNVGTFIGMGAITSATKGFSPSKWTEEQIKKAQSYILSFISSGVFGVSCGIMYTPEFYSSRDDYIKILSVLKGSNIPLVTHMRSEGDSLISAVEEVLDIAEKTDIPLNISHFKVFGKSNWEKTLPNAIKMIDERRARGNKVTVDFYPYTGGSTTLLTLLPPQFVKTSVKETLDYLRSKEVVSLLKTEIVKKQPRWDNMVEAIGWDRIIVSSVANSFDKWTEGKNLSEIALAMECDETEAMVTLLEREEGQVGIIVMSMDQKDVDSVASLDYSLVISDSLYGANDNPHPRLYGSFPRFLNEYCIKKKTMTFDEGLKKLTGNVARLYSIKDRGFLREGYFADIAVLDIKNLHDNATFDSPKQLCDGIEMVFVNGQLAYKDKTVLDSSAGHVLRRR